jgi:cytochrome c biogenesis protein CcmG, thiol:disulfide interchange protein DsbE
MVDQETEMHQRQRQIIYLLILAIGFAWIFVSADKSGGSTSGQIPAPQQGFLAPDFELKSPTGETIKLTDLRGQAVLVNLWATWCPPCRAEMQSIEKMYQEYKDQGFTVLGVNMTYQDDPSAVMPFVNEQKLTFPILLDETGNMANAYQLRSLPSSYFIRRDGIINEVVIGGPMAEALLRTRIEAILK